MLHAYRSQDWAKARKYAEACKRMDASFSPLYDLYEERISFFEESPPGENWDGVFVAESK